jgi:hypothetical protein
MSLVPKDMEEMQHPEAVVKIANENPAVPLLALKTPVYGNDPNELIKHRFLYRGGILLLSGPTGAGKSSFTMQWGISLAGGVSCFGMKVGDCYYQKGLRVLVIQAENDEGDLAEQRDGVVSVFYPELIERAGRNLSFISMPDAAGEVFAARLSALCEFHRPDIVFIDPVFSFLGGDNSAQKDVSHWVRNLLLPIMKRFNCSCVLIHHQNKPQKDAVNNGAYSMSGSAEWANAARACLNLESVGNGVFKLTATKRGDRLGWKDDSEQKTLVRYIAHHGGTDEGGRAIIAWRDAEESEIPQPATKGRNSKVTVQDVVKALRGRGSLATADLQKIIEEETGAARSPTMERIGEAVSLGLVEPLRMGKRMFYTLKNEGEK